VRARDIEYGYFVLYHDDPHNLFNKLKLKLIHIGYLEYEDVDETIRYHDDSTEVDITQLFTPSQKA